MNNHENTETLTVGTLDYLGKHGWYFIIEDGKVSKVGLE